MAWMLLHKAEMYAASHDTCAVRGQADTFRVRLRIVCKIYIIPKLCITGLFCVGPRGLRIAI